jgi:FkbM family methyltransferase
MKRYSQTDHNIMLSCLPILLNCVPWIMSQFSQRRHLHRQGAERRAEFVSVPTMTLARVPEDQHISRPDLLKLDIEGNEYEVLYSTPIEHPANRTGISP